MRSASTRAGVALDFLACGLDPAKATLFRQSDVPEVTELAWLLTCLTPMPMLENCHAYKDYLARPRDEPPSHGLFAYPVLMAADILLYDSNVVPVGRDQKQHVEVTRDLAEKWNRELGTTFQVPEASILADAATIPGLDGQKMSKSYDNTIGLFEEEKPLRKKIMGIVTDSTPVEAPKNPEGSAILRLYRLFASEADVQHDGAGIRRRRRRVWRSEEAALRRDLGIFCGDAGAPCRAGEGPWVYRWGAGRGRGPRESRGGPNDAAGAAGCRSAMKKKTLHSVGNAPIEKRIETGTRHFAYCHGLNRLYC